MGTCFINNTREVQACKGKTHKKPYPSLWWPLGLLVAYCAAQQKTQPALGFLSHSASSHKCMLSVQFQHQHCGDEEIK